MVLPPRNTPSSGSYPVLCFSIICRPLCHLLRKMAVFRPPRADLLPLNIRTDLLSRVHYDNPDKHRARLTNWDLPPKALWVHQHTDKPVQCSSMEWHPVSSEIWIFVNRPGIFFMLVRRGVQNRLGFESWNQHPARELPTLASQEECLEDCELSPISVHPACFAESQTVGMRPKVGGTCPLLSTHPMLVLSHALYINPTIATWW